MCIGSLTCGIIQWVIQTMKINNLVFIFVEVSHHLILRQDPMDLGIMAQWSPLSIIWYKQQTVTMPYDDRNWHHSAIHGCKITQGLWSWIAQWWSLEKGERISPSLLSSPLLSFLSPALLLYLEDSLKQRKKEMAIGRGRGRPQRENIFLCFQALHRRERAEENLALQSFWLSFWFCLCLSCCGCARARSRAEQNRVPESRKERREE